MSPIAPGDLLAIGSAACFAAANIAIAKGARAGADDNGAFVSLLLTTLIAGAGWLAAGLWRGFEPVTARSLAWFVGAGVLTAFVGRVFFHASVQHLGAMRSSTMKRLNPFFAVILGVLVLGETLTGGMVLGLVLIAASFMLLVLAGSRPAARGGAGTWRNIGYLYGPVSALGYATGYLLRKMGLADAPDALLGASVGCATGALLFLAAAVFRAEYARAVRATFAQPNGWLIAGGVMSTFGQILYFAALSESPMSRVALITSMEVFVTLFAGALLLRRHEAITPGLVVAALLGVLGTAAVIGR